MGQPLLTPYQIDLRLKNIYLESEQNTREKTTFTKTIDITNPLAIKTHKKFEN